MGSGLCILLLVFFWLYRARGYGVSQAARLASNHDLLARLTMHLLKHQYVDGVKPLKMTGYS
jgi:hypothetical protein